MMVYLCFIKNHSGIINLLRIGTLLFFEYYYCVYEDAWASLKVSELPAMERNKDLCYGI